MAILLLMLLQGLTRALVWNWSSRHELVSLLKELRWYWNVASTAIHNRRFTGTGTTTGKAPALSTAKAHSLFYPCFCIFLDPLQPASIGIAQCVHKRNDGQNIAFFTFSKLKIVPVVWHESSHHSEIIRNIDITEQICSIEIFIKSKLGGYWAYKVEDPKAEREDDNGVKSAWIGWIYDCESSSEPKKVVEWIGKLGQRFKICDFSNLLGHMVWCTYQDGKIEALISRLPTVIWFSNLVEELNTWQPINMRLPMSKGKIQGHKGHAAF